MSAGLLLLGGSRSNRVLPCLSGSEAGTRFRGHRSPGGSLQRSLPGRKDRSSGFLGCMVSSLPQGHPGFGELHQDFGGEDFQVLGIAVYSGTREDVSAFIQEHHIEYPMVVGDDDIVEDFGVIGYPTYFVIDPEGNVYKKHVGELEDLYDRVAKDIAILKER